MSRNNKNVKSIYPEEMINDNISVISMDTIIDQPNEHNNNKNMSTKSQSDINKYLKRVNERSTVAERRIMRQDSFLMKYDSEYRERNSYYKYKLALDDLMPKYNRLKLDHEKLIKHNEDIINKLNKENNIMSMKTKFYGFSYKYNCKLPIPNDNQRFKISKIYQIIPSDTFTGNGVKALCYGPYSITIDYNQGFSIGDILLIDVTNVNSARIVHKFSDKEIYDVLNWATDENRFSKECSFNEKYKLAINEFINLYKGFICG